MTTWRVLTWNILGAHDPNLDVISKVISGYPPDVVALQEVRRRQARGPGRSPRLDDSSGLASTIRSRHSCGGVPRVGDRHAALDRRPVSVSISPGVSTWTFKHRVAMAATVTRGRDAARSPTPTLPHTMPTNELPRPARVAPLVGAQRPAVVAGDFNAVDEVEVIREFGPQELVDPGGDVLRIRRSRRISGRLRACSRSRRP